MTMERLSKMTDVLPVIGGIGGAFSQSTEIIHYLPTMQAVTSTIIITIIGAAIGYLTKLALDKIFCKKCKK